MFVLDQNFTFILWPTETSLASLVASEVVTGASEIVAFYVVNGIRQLIESANSDLRSSQQRLVVAYNSLSDSLAKFQSESDRLTRYARDLTCVVPFNAKRTVFGS